MKLSSRIWELHPRNVFRISRGERRVARNVFVRIEQDGFAGYGEASPNAYYGETAGQVSDKLKAAAAFLAEARVSKPRDIEKIWVQAWPLLSPSRAAQCALDVALWDWLAKKMGCPAGELALGHPAQAVGSFATVGISEPDELEEKIAELAGFARVKVKSGPEGDLGTARRIRAAMPNAGLAIDANCSWGGLDLGRLGASLKEIGAEFVEQPLRPECDSEMPAAARQLGARVMADESCVTEKDVERMGGLFAGFNIKLVKCGGLTPALRMARRGRELKQAVMVGCMLESSLLIAAGAVAAQLADYADLDGAWLLADDPAAGWRFDRGMLHPPEGAGLGAGLTPELFDS